MAITANTGSNNWNTNGAWVGGVQPTAADDVIIPASAVVTIPSATTALGRSLTVQASGTLAFAANTSVLTLGDGTAGAGNVAISISATATITLTGVGAINLISTSATQQTITTNGKTLPFVTINGAGSSYLASDSITNATNATFTLTAGTFNFNALTHNFGFVSMTGSTTRTWNMTNATINVTGSAATVWTAATITNLTFTSTGSTLNFTGTGSTLGALAIAWGGLTYATVNFAATAGLSTFSNSPTITTLNITANTTTINEIRLANNITATNLTLNGNSVTNRLMMRSNTIGTTRTITATSLTTNGWVDFQDITGAGAATWNDMFGVQNVTGITGASPVTCYWVGGSGNINDTAHYASSSGGTGGTQRAPLMQDTAIFDANSGTGTLAFVGNRIGTVNFTGTALTSITFSGGFDTRFLCGDFILSATCPITFSGFASAVVLCGRGSQTFSMNGTQILVMSFAVNTTGTYTLGSDLSVGATLTFTQTLGTFTTNNYTVDTGTLASNAGTLNLGSSTINLNITTAVTVWTVAAGVTLDAGTSNIYANGAGITNQSFSGGGKTYNNVYFTYANTGIFSLTGATNNTFNLLMPFGTPVAKTLRFVSSTTTTFLTANFPGGASGALLTVRSVTAASAATITSAFTLSTDFVAMQDLTGAGSTPHYAGANSTNTSGNTNWTFTGPPSASNFLMFM